MRNGGVGRIAKVLIALATAAALGGCFHVPARAWANGRELGYTEESMVIYGPHDPHATRALNSRLQASAHGWQMARPFTPFQRWDW